mgnify:CR=1 FL=1
MDTIPVGLIGEVEMTVTEDDTAERWGSGLVAILENAAVKALNGHLPSGQTSVGGRMDVRHLAPTPVGMDVRARGELVEASGHRLVFRVEAWDEVEKIGEATHERFAVDEERFIAEAEAKVGAAASDEG